MVTRSAILLTVFIGITIPSMHAETPVLRSVLGLYDSSEGLTASDNPIQQRAAFVLHHLGMNVIFHDIHQGLPPDEVMSEIQGIITWFTDGRMKNPEAYCRWLAKQRHEGRRLIILDTLGAGEDSFGKPTSLEGMNTAFGALGLRYGGGFSRQQLSLDIRRHDPDMTEFERKLHGDELIYEQWTSIDPANRIYLTIAQKRIPGSESALVVSGPHGGFVGPGYVTYTDPGTFKTRWRINPFRFFEEALGLTGLPRPDVTTLNGRRLLFIHIDGDGLANASQIQNQTLGYALSRTSGEIIREQFLKRYPWPTTVSIIEAETQPKPGGDTKLEDLARSLFAIPHVEAGSHSYSHPLDWSGQLVSFVLDNYSTLMSTFTSAAARETHYPNAAMVRKPASEFWNRELTQSIGYVETLLPPYKRVRLFQWSGNCLPPAGALAVLRGQQVRNINGGDGRMDTRHPSYTSLAPLYRREGAEVQVHTANANDNIYLLESEGSETAYRQVRQTFEQTEYPTLLGPRAKHRRVLPINIYYHFFSAQKPSFLSALQDVYDYTAGQRDRLAPVFTSEYVEMVHGFLSATLHRREDGAWVARRLGACRTLRFDHETRQPDLRTSHGVLGYSRWKDHLYVHLTGEEPVVIRLAAHPSRRIYVEEASTMIYRWERHPHETRFETRAFEPTVIRMAGVHPRSSWTVTITGTASTDTQTHQGSAEGTFLLPLPGEGIFKIRISPAARDLS